MLTLIREENDDVYNINVKVTLNKRQSDYIQHLLKKIKKDNSISYIDRLKLENNFDESAILYFLVLAPRKFLIEHDLISYPKYPDEIESYSVLYDLIDETFNEISESSSYYIKFSKAVYDITISNIYDQFKRMSIFSKLNFTESDLIKFRIFGHRSNNSKLWSCYHRFDKMFETYVEMLYENPTIKELTYSIIEEQNPQSDLQESEMNEFVKDLNMTSREDMVACIVFLENKEFIMSCLVERLMDQNITRFEYQKLVEITSVL